MLQDLVTTGEAARACGVGKSTIRVWVFRGYLSRVESDDHGHSLYLLGDVLLAARDTRRRACGARRIA